MAEGIKKLTTDRGILKAHLTRFKTFLDTVGLAQGLIALETRLQKIEPLFDRFDEIQAALENGATEEQQPAVEKERVEFENSYFDLVTRARMLMQNDGHGQHPNINDPIQGRAEVGNVDRQQIGVNLPVIKIPSFDGSPERWIKFRDTFQSMIDGNRALTNIQKFHYLDSAITGDAARAISALGISTENYPIAWEALKKRFDDAKALSHFHVKGLFELQAMAKDSHKSLRQLIDKATNHLLSLENMGEAVNGWDSMIVYLLSTKLDASTRREWDKKVSQLEEKPKLKEMTNFLNAHCRYLERSDGDKNEVTTKNQNTSSSANTGKPSQRSKSGNVSANVTQNMSCPICDGSHNIYHCEEFIKLPAKSKLTEVQKRKLCFNCLRSDHQNKDCKAGHCRRCSKKHNTLLHPEDSSQEDSAKSEVSANVSVVSTEGLYNVSCNHAQKRETPVILATAIVRIQDGQGITRDCRVLLDAGAQSHFVTQDLCNRLNLKLTPIHQPVSGIGQQQTNLKFKTQINIKSKFNAFSTSITCLVIANITGDMPNVPIDLANLRIPTNLTLADPKFYEPRPVDLLIGSEIFWSLLCVGQVPLGPALPIMQKTKLGWVLGGPMRMPSQIKSKSASHCHLVTTQQLHDQVARFWALEECTSPQISKGKTEDSICENYFQTTTARNDEGRLVVSMPFRETLQDLGQSKERARRRFLAIEKKLKRDTSLSDEYRKFMLDYETSGHMSKLAFYTPEENTIAYYLPHHAVTKEGSTTTKVRVVFDGSAKTSSGLSINDVQYVGPVVQDDLFSILLRFRKHKFVISADIKQMYRQVLIHEDQRKFQRILWRENESSPIHEYQLNTITYGMASAPFLATRALQQVAKDHATDCPEASRVIQRDFYMDDLLTGAESVQKAQELKSTISGLLLNYGFDLRKWASNHEAIVKSEENEQRQLPFHDLKDAKTLGLLWKPELDTLSFALDIPAPSAVTKRTILSIIASIFDPLGLIAPIVVSAKIILQGLWQLNLSWDEALPQDVHTAWDRFHRSLNSLDDIKIPRHAFGNLQDVQIHGFSDASERAYGACVYIRTKEVNGEVNVSLLCAKSRVAPLKTVTLPRLELSAALLLARLMHRVSISLDIGTDHQHFWCDSTIVLCYIAAEPSKWTTFVANRTAEIQDITNTNWRHVPTADNPADLASRGTDVASLSSSRLWWNGPHWLCDDEHAWPKLSKPIVTAIPDMKSRPITTLTITNISEEFGIQISSYTRMTRVLAYVLRFIENSRKRKPSRNTAPLSVQELEGSSNRLLRLAQRQDFVSEIECLETDRRVPKKSPIANLHPFLDSEGCLRVGGRIRNAPIPFEQKHPILVSHRNVLAVRLIEREHLRLLHAGPQLVQASLRTRYWISSGKAFIKKILRQCVKCFCTNPTPASYQMGDLPEARITPSRPFYVSGVDYAGPFYIREKSRCKTIIKAYLCVFVCFSTKAVHFELATDMSTNAFLNCLRRFIARRGKCKVIHSDNGTNFVGAANELSELRKLLKNKNHNDQVRDFLSLDMITWHNIPPHAPNFGGLWESAVKSAKHHLKRILSDLPLTYEELYTVLTQIEAILNSRPLSPLSDDPNDLIPLTPAHFLIGDSLTALPTKDFQDANIHRLTRYERLQQLVQHFWRRWNVEYLHQLQTRSKWNTQPATTIKPGLMVVLRDDNTAPMNWQLGRIETVHPGNDNIVRVVTVKTASGIYQRPLTKICLLPIQDSKPSVEST